MANRHTRIRTKHAAPAEKPVSAKEPAPRRSATAAGTRARREPPPLEEVPDRRKPKRGKMWLRVILRLAIAVSATAGIILVWYNWDKIAPDGIVFSINQWLSGSKKGEFPINVTGSTVIGMGETSEGLSVLTDTSYLLYNASGGELIRRQHGYADPKLVTAGKWALIYDLGNTGLRLDSHAGAALELTTEQKIISASVNENGDVAVVTFAASSNFSTEVAVYNRKKERLYLYQSSDLHLLSASVNADGSAFAAAGSTGKEGATQSGILFFDMKKEGPVHTVTDVGTLLFHVAYLPSSKDTVAAIGSTGLYVADSGGALQKRVGYDDHTLNGFALSADTVTVVLRHYSGGDGGIALGVSAAGEVRYRSEFEGAFHSIGSCKTGAYVLTSLYLYQSDDDGLSRRTAVTRDGKYVSSLGDRAIVSGLTELQEYRPK